MQTLKGLPDFLLPLKTLVPPGTEPDVALWNKEKKRRIRRDASIENWKPDPCRAIIAFGKKTTDQEPLAGLRRTAFRPLRIRGKSLSDTVIEDRRCPDGRPMAAYYFDTSALVKLNVAEPGADYVLRVVSDAAGSTIVHDGPDSPESQLIGGPIQQNPDKVRRADPITYVSADDPPFLIVHGDGDKLVPHDQSVLLDKALRKAGVDVTFHTVVGGGHGRGGEFGTPELFERVRGFFDRHLRNRQR